VQAQRLPLLREIRRLDEADMEAHVISDLRGLSACKSIEAAGRSCSHGNDTPTYRQLRRRRGGADADIAAIAGCSRVEQKRHPPDSPLSRLNESCIEAR